MLSAFVLIERTLLPRDDKHRARVVVRTLAALVNLVVSDVVADATLITRADPALQGIDDIAGCAISEGSTLGDAFARALPTARRPHALVLRAGYAADQSIATEIVERLGSARDDGALLVRATSDTPLQRLVPSLAPAVGVIASLAALQSLQPTNDDVLRVLTRKLPVRALRARAAPIP